MWREWYEYDVGEGTTQREVDDLSEELADYFASFRAYSPSLRILRDHALIVYAHLGVDYDHYSRARRVTKVG